MGMQYLCKYYESVTFIVLFFLLILFTSDFKLFWKNFYVPSLIKRLFHG